MDLAGLQRWEALPGVRVARDVLRRANGVEVTLVDAQGPLPHQLGGVMKTGAAACDVALFSPEGFRVCDAFYREVGAADKACRRDCPMGLRSMAVPITIDGEVVAHAVASGFASEHRQLVADRFVALGLTLPPDPVQIVDPTDRRFIAATLEACVAEIEAAEHARRASRRGRSETLESAFSIVGDSPPMRALFEELPKLAASDATVLILGESGTGKELVASALHAQSRRSNAPFVAQNCGALSDDLLESALFGHVRGAFTGADRVHDGLFKAAKGGTLFLDEVGEMSQALQAKLLRVLQDGSYSPVGSTDTKTADVRVLAATHRDLPAMVEAGSFRRDLYFRMNVLRAVLPPLRDRTGDVRRLVTHFLRVSQAPQSVSESAWKCLERYAWPGNVRELRAEISRWELSASDAREILPKHLSREIRRSDGYAVGPPKAIQHAFRGDQTLAEAVETLERAMIEQGLDATDGNRTALAKRLGISRTTLADRMKRYEID